jgi:protease I
MKKLLIFVENGVEDSEFIYSYYRFQEDGYKMDVVAPEKHETYVGKHGVPFKSDLSPREVQLENYDGLIIPGGRAPDRMRMNKDLVNIVKKAYEAGKIIAAVCHGPQMLIEADIVKGKRVTSWPSVRTDLKNAGAIVLEESAVVDGNIVTSRSPEDLPNFCQVTLNLLQEGKMKR